MALAVVLSVCYSATSQETKFGVKGGANFATLSGDDTDGIDGRTGFHIGGLAEIMFNDSFGVQPELVYSNQGASEEFSESGLTGKYTLKLDYINVPILAKYFLTSGLNVNLGPQVGFAINKQEEFELSGDGLDESGSEDLEGVNDFDFGLAGGLGYQLDMGVFINARYTLGLSNLSEDGGDDYSIQNNVIQVSVGYMF